MLYIRAQDQRQEDLTRAKVDAEAERLAAQNEDDAKALRAGVGEVMLAEQNKYIELPTLAPNKVSSDSCRSVHHTSQGSE